jgi:hypothetical protein
MASTSEEEAGKAQLAYASIPLRDKEMACKQAIIELLHLEFSQYGKELAADLFMDIAKSSPYVGVKRGGDHKDSLLYRFCNVPMYWLSINTTDYKEAEKLFVSAGQDIVAYLEYKFYEDYEEALARGVPLVEDGEELSEQQFFDAQLYSITEFKDFDEDEWRAARYLIDCYEEEIMKHQRAKKKRAEHGNNRQKHHSIN